MVARHGVLATVGAVRCVVRSLVLLVGLVALLTMHGFDAAAAAAHGPAPGVTDAPPEAHGAHGVVAPPAPTVGGEARFAPSDAPAQHGGDLAVVCTAVFLVAAGVVLRRIVRHAPHGLIGAAVTAGGSLGEEVSRILRPPPAWVRLCVIRR